MTSIWAGASSIVEDDYVLIIRPTFEEEKKIGRVPITIFRLEENTWSRSDVTLLQQCYSEREITSALTSAGFTSIQSYDALNNLALPSGIGRTFFLCRKP
jgi:hypothetical protein